MVQMNFARKTNQHVDSSTPNTCFIFIANAARLTLLQNKIFNLQLNQKKATHIKLANRSHNIRFLFWQHWELSTLKCSSFQLKPKILPRIFSADGKSLWPQEGDTERRSSKVNLWFNCLYFRLH